MADRPTPKSLPEGLSQPALRALAGAGITRLEQLAKITEPEIAKLHGMGPSGIKLLRAALAAKRLSFKPATRK